MTGNTIQNQNQEYENQCEIFKNVDFENYVKFKDYIEKNKNKSNMYPLEWCSIFGKYFCLELLLKSGIDPNHKASTGQSLLMWMCVNDRHLGLFSKMLSYFTNLDEQDEHGNTILHYIIQCADKFDCKICKYLESELINNYGFDITIKNNYGHSYESYKKTHNRTPDDEYNFQLKLLASYTESYDGKIRLYEQFMKTEEILYPLEWIYAKNNLHCFEYMLKAGANINHVLFDGLTMWNKILDSVKYYGCLFLDNLLALAALSYVDNINQQDKNGTTILHVLATCRCKKCYKICERLIKNGADITIKNNYGNSYESYIKASYGTPDDEYDLQLKLLKAFNDGIMGVSIYYQKFSDAEEKLYPLEWVYANNLCGIFKYMLKAGANINHVLFDGRTLWAKMLNSIDYNKCINDDRCLIYVALPYIDNINQQDKHGNTILHILAICGCKKCGKLCTALIVNGADMHIKNNKNDTLLDINITHLKKYID